MDWQTLSSQFARTLSDLQDTPDAERVEFWVQTWAETSCGHGYGGQAFTPALVAAVVYLPPDSSVARLRAYSGGRLLYDVVYGPEQRQALEDRNLPGKGMRWRVVRP